MKTVELPVIPWKQWGHPDEATARQELVKGVDVAIASSFEKEPTPQQRREVGQVMALVDELFERDRAEFPDKRWAALQGWWNTSRLPAQTGGGRKVLEWLDRLICPDEYSGEAD